jgi:sugar O-acyltransferase (sialic acid O-acetyltransferase NeuD family)
MAKLILFPFGGNAREAVTVVEAINAVSVQWELLGFADDDSRLWGKESRGNRVLGGRDVLNDEATKVLAVPGRPDTYARRRGVIESLNLSERRYATLVHPSAQIGSDARIGYNTLVMAGVVVTASVSIGNHCVILPNTVVSHDSIVEDFCMIGSNVSISGGVRIESESYIGSGARLIQEITVGAKSLVGIGAVVLRSTQAGSVVAGNPARPISKGP